MKLSPPTLDYFAAKQVMNSWLAYNNYSFVPCTKCNSKFPKFGNSSSEKIYLESLNAVVSCKNDDNFVIENCREPNMICVEHDVCTAICLEKNFSTKGPHVCNNL